MILLKSSSSVSKSSVDIGPIFKGTMVSEIFRENGVVHARTPDITTIM